MRSGIRDHGLFILAENIPNVSRRRRTIVLDKREDRQMGWAKRTRWEDERSAYDRRERESQRSGAEFLILLNANGEIASETTFRAHAIVYRLGPKTSVIRLAVQISH